MPVICTAKPCASAASASIAIASSKSSTPTPSRLIGTVPKATLEDVRQAFSIARAYKSKLTRFDRAAILNKAAAIVRNRTEEFANLITAESGLCKKDSLYEIGRVSDVLLFGATECLKDDGQIFSCDLTPHGKKRRVYTQRDPLLGVICAITPFNHPMNQVAHKVVPSIVTNNRMVLKPSEKVPLSAIALADVLYEAGLPPPMYQVVTGDPKEIADELITNPNVDLVTFTGGVAIGKYIASKAGYRRMVLELGGNDPIIVMEDADVEEAASLAAAGSYKNSGQRCTAVKRMLVHERRRRPLRRAAGRQDEGLELRRSDGRQARHGHRDRRGRGTLLRRQGQRGRLARRQGAGGKPAARRALFADGRRSRRAADAAGAAGNVRAGADRMRR